MIETVGDLIAALSEYPMDTPVALFDGGDNPLVVSKGSTMNMRSRKTTEIVFIREEDINEDAGL